MSKCKNCQSNLRYTELKCKYCGKYVFGLPQVIIGLLSTAVILTVLVIIVDYYAVNKLPEASDEGVINIQQSPDSQRQGRQRTIRRSNPGQPRPEGKRRL